MQVTLYSRPGCHLCEDAEKHLRVLQRRIPFTLAIVDIESDDDLLRRYMLEIPVVTAGDTVIARAPITPQSLETALRAVSPSG